MMASHVPEIPAAAGPPPRTDFDLLEAFRQRYPFPLDPFQEEAIRHILAGKSVIVSAPTGAGKTLVAEFAIYRTLAAQRRLAYTTPLKALSNQKYADFCRQYGPEFVGILTGDVKVNPRAPVLVMTTEILRNLFYTDPMENLATVVLDECHYMGDEGRGTVWEELIITCPKAVQLVALSATVQNIAEIADWIGQTHGPIHAVHHPVRPVPLQTLLCDQEGRIATLEAAGRRAAEPPRGRPHGWRDRDRRRHGGEFRRRPVHPSRLIPELVERGWVPTLYFIFSRAGCERALEFYLERGPSLLEPRRAAEVEEAIAHALRDYPSITPESELNALVFRGLRRGVGVHHAGMLPALKRLTEVLFERGLVRVVFATETMSLGIHMPAKSVVIQGLRKRSDAGFRFLTMNEITQMGGRAGRRGIDLEGKCVIGLDTPEGAEEARALLARPPEPIESRFRIGYSSAALLLMTYKDPPLIRSVIESSFGQYQNRRRIRELESRRADLALRQAQAEGFQSPCCELPTLMRYRSQRAILERERQRLPGFSGASRRQRKAQAAAWSLESLADVRERVAALEAALAQMPCHRCPHRGPYEARLKRSRKLVEAMEGHRRAQEELEGSYWEQFLRVVDVLGHFGYVKGGTLTPEGRLIGGLRHDNELLVARAVFSGAFDGLKGAEAAALLSCLTEEPRETARDAAKAFLRAQGHLRRRLQSLELLAGEVERVQDRYKVPLPFSLHSALMAATARWAAGEEDWAGLVDSAYGGHEGDLIRAFRRLIDLGRQLVDSPDLPERLRPVLVDAVGGLDRGIVLESALI
ncbi:MAG TPA: DEAD/DEAH box helicase [Candidatus Sulfotelmatobacter sp.]|nr:DEAD/DEAH box helicase [Candidatus Sulfotelmatobacter sp.]